MREWIVIYCVALISFMLGALLIPTVLSVRDEWREKRESSRRRTIILPGEMPSPESMSSTGAARK